jgi:hypothetical protein
MLSTPTGMADTERSADVEEYTTDFLTTKEAAPYLGIKTQSFRWLVTEKIITSYLATPDEITELRRQKRITVVPPGGIRLIAKAELARYLQERRAPGPQIVSRRGDEKRCSTCKEWKPITEFGEMRNHWDGLNYKCKLCNAAHVRAYKEQRRAQGIKTRNAPSEQPKQCATCQRVKPAKDFGISRTNPDGRNYNCRACRSAKGTHPLHNEYTRAYYQRYPDRNRARSAVADAVRYGRMPPARKLTCIDCGEPAAHYHHHRGYAEEYKLDVVPVCTACHAKADLR